MSHTLSSYLLRVPKSKDDIPPGKWLVHNNIKPRNWNLGLGFRIWLQEPDWGFKVCDCGWHPELGTHYRVDPDWHPELGYRVSRKNDR